MFSINRSSIIKPVCRQENYQPIDSNKPQNKLFTQSQSSSNISCENIQANFIPFLGKKFNHRIIDCHGHIDSSNITGHFDSQNLTPAKIKAATDIKNQTNCSVDYVAISNISGIDTIDNQPGSNPLQNQTEANLETIRMCNKPEYNNLLPLAVCQPGKGNADEIEQLLEQNRFYGLKFHPYYLNLNSDDKNYDPFLDLAKKHDLPCFFHAAPGTSDPKYIINLAKRHPDVPVVLYHINLGADCYSAINIVKQSIDNDKTNLFVDFSWAPENVILDAINIIGEDRVLFGTDTAISEMGDPEEYSKRVKNIIKTIKNSYNEDWAEEILEKIFYENSHKIFQL